MTEMQYEAIVRRPARPNGVSSIMVGVPWPRMLPRGDFGRWSTVHHTLTLPDLSTVHVDYDGCQSQKCKLQFTLKALTQHNTKSNKPAFRKNQRQQEQESGVRSCELRRDVYKASGWRC